MKVVQNVISSEVLGRNISVKVLIPEGSNLKCIFLLHGYDGDHNQWLDHSRIAELARNNGTVIVMPGCGNGYYEDTQENMSCFLGKELVSYVRTNFPISPCREDLSIAGVSMGGFGALLVGIKYYDVFSKIASFSGAFILKDISIGNPGVLGNADVNYFRQVFGDFESLEGSDRDPVAEAIRLSTQGETISVFLACGTEDVLFERNKEVNRVLNNHGIKTTWIAKQGGHCWQFWNDILPDAVNWLTGG